MPVIKDLGIQHTLQKFRRHFTILTRLLHSIHHLVKRRLLCCIMIESTSADPYIDTIVVKDPAARHESHLAAHRLRHVVQKTLSETISINIRIPAVLFKEVDAEYDSICIKARRARSGHSKAAHMLRRVNKRNILRAVRYLNRDRRISCADSRKEDHERGVGLELLNRLAHPVHHPDDIR